MKTEVKQYAILALFIVWEKKHICFLRFDYIVSNIMKQALFTLTSEARIDYSGNIDRQSAINILKFAANSSTSNVTLV